MSVIASARAALVVMALVVVVACGGAGSSGPSTSSPVDNGSAPAAGPSQGGVTTVPDKAASGPGQLVDATEQLGLTRALIGIRGHAVATADVNGDGWPDLFVGTFADREPDSYRQRGAEGPAPDRLLLGSPSGFVIDQSFEGRLGRSAGALFEDLDNDGDPDLVVSRNVRPAPRADVPSEIYRNEQGRLTPWLVLDDRRGGRAVRSVDFDGDGWRDLVLVEDRWSGGSTVLYRNEEGGGFRDVTVEAGLPSDVSGLGAAVGDLDGDGLDDLVIGGSNRWFLGTGTGFVEGDGSPLPWTTHGDEDDAAQVVLFDADGDGRLDVLIGQHFNSTLDSGRPEPIRLFLNRGGGPGPAGLRLEDVTETVGLPPLATKSPQVLLLDLSGDGRPELVTTASSPGPDGGPAPVVIDAVGPGPSYITSATDMGPHYWIDGVTLDADRDGRLDAFFVEWEPADSARLFLNEPR